MRNNFWKPPLVIYFVNLRKILTVFSNSALRKTRGVFPNFLPRGMQTDPHVLASKETFSINFLKFTFLKKIFLPLAGQKKQYEQYLFYGI